ASDDELFSMLDQRFGGGEDLLMSGDNGMTEEKLRRYLKRTVTELDSVTARLREVEHRAGE
uniref:Erythronolide synthase n=1 Tax=Saccharopolyspora erythraea TaxID=1836 RepID=UPI00002400DD|nr:Chain A, Erythronolide synthase [Saccharopolyspora erythraea]1PZR_B Chain B, Erythronolide synthase [Saccharopolyspora erythraea]